MGDERVEIPGSALKPSELVPVDSSERLDVTLVLRRSEAARQAGEHLLRGEWQPNSRERAEEMLRADPRDLSAVRSFAQQYGLQIIDECADTRTVRLEGSVEAMERAFVVKLGYVTSAEGKCHLSYSGVISVPAALAEAVTAVLGLDQRPVARVIKA